MNYRHAFHAGNFADCMKHALFLAMLARLQTKPAGLMIFDTHAGIGQYDLATGAAARTGEYTAGIARLLDHPPEPLAPYIDAVQSLGLYPGSPALARAALRPQDRLVLNELHPEDHITLRRAFARDPQTEIHHRDAWEILPALLPPRERRALILIDPPYEAEEEYTRLTDALKRAHTRFPTGTYAAWYPIKHRAPVRAFHQALRDSKIKDIIATELHLRAPLDPTRLNGCGLAIINPPYGTPFDPILAALLARLGTGEEGAGVTIERITDE